MLDLELHLWDQKVNVFSFMRGTIRVPHITYTTQGTTLGWNHLIPHWSETIPEMFKSDADKVSLDSYFFNLS